MMMPQEALAEHFRKYKILSEKEIEEIVLLARIKSLGKGDFFTTEGEVCREVAWVRSGMFRSYYVSSEGEEITYCITFPASLLTAYSSFITGSGTPENIQAITNAELFVLPRSKIEEFSRNSYRWQSLLRSIAEQQYLELEQRIFLLQKEKARQRYLRLLDEHPEFVRSIPLQYLASYLGITQRHLSRLRKEIAF